MQEGVSKKLKPKDKIKLGTGIEQNKSRRVFVPDVDIYETEKEIKILADMPGVSSDKINVSLRDNILTLEGEVETLEEKNETPVFKEFETGKYYRQFTLSHVIDQSKIKAELKDGVLKITLPKVETSTPRKIEVRTE